jgi:chromosome condensin MukBEF MukE localization factor
MPVFINLRAAKATNWDPAAVAAACYLLLSPRRLSQHGLFIARACAEFVSEVPSEIYRVYARRLV